MFNIDSAAVQRLALNTCLLWCALLFAQSTSIYAQIEDQNQKDIPSEQLLPSSTKGWISIPDVTALKDSVDRSQFGKLLNDPALKPWVADMKQHAVDVLNKNNLRLGLELADLDPINTGEIAVATVLYPGDDSYAIVVLINIKDAKDETDALIQKIEARLKEKGAEKETKDFQATNYNQWKFPAPNPRSWRKQRFAYNAVVNDWLVITDHEPVCRELLRRIVTPSIDDADNLASNATFSAISTKLEVSASKYKAQINWFVEPWGYIKIAKKIAEEQQAILQPDSGHDRIYQDEGFDAIKGVGGWLTVSTEKHELVHQTYIYAPATVEGINRYLKAAAILDFSNPDADELEPLAWMPNEISSLTSMTWDLNKVVNNVGSLIESMMGSEGSYQNMLDAFEEDLKLEKPVKELVSSLGRRINLITDIETPIDERSERVLISIKVDKDDSLIQSTIEKFIGEADLVVEEYKGHRIAVVDLTKKNVAAPEIDIDPLDDPLAPPKNQGDDEKKDEEKGLKPIFEKRVICVAHKHVFVSNNVDYMKKLLDKVVENRGELLKSAGDYQRVQAALNEIDSRTPSIKHFGRIDRSVRVNYEMMRQGKMESSQTMLAQILEQIVPKNDSGISNRPKVDIKKMPADFDNSVAKYLGLTGWKMISEEDGWSIVGCILPKINDEEASINEAANGDAKVADGDDKEIKTTEETDDNNSDDSTQPDFNR